ncbi:Protein priA [Grifola frondosa]|uniref:Protein priA n=1 Tax=Grifola frondosa TaxID=5627 RepID=A0A1C7MS05_GRIFR|nr:Protein priA [Grifola frondosa]
MRSFTSLAISLLLVALSSSRLVAALPSDNALNARAPIPSAPARRYEARAPTPSAPSRRYEARAPAPSNSKRHVREQEPIIPTVDLSAYLCPEFMSVCPLEGAARALASEPASMLELVQNGFECVDFREDLTSCGGCGSIEARYDCTAIPGALGVSCIAGGCRVHSCKVGYSLTPDGKSCV